MKDRNGRETPREIQGRGRSRKRGRSRQCREREWGLWDSGGREIYGGPMKSSSQ